MNYNPSSLPLLLFSLLPSLSSSLPSFPFAFSPLSSFILLLCHSLTPFFLLIQLLLPSSSLLPSPTPFLLTYFPPFLFIPLFLPSFLHFFRHSTPLLTLSFLPSFSLPLSLSSSPHSVFFRLGITPFPTFLIYFIYFLPSLFIPLIPVPLFPLCPSSRLPLSPFPFNITLPPFPSLLCLYLPFHSSFSFLFHFLSFPFSSSPYPPFL